MLRHGHGRLRRAQHDSRTAGGGGVEMTADGLVE